MTRTWHSTKLFTFLYLLTWIHVSQEYDNEGIYSYKPFEDDYNDRNI
jgi:hypothetical protein